MLSRRDLEKHLRAWTRRLEGSLPQPEVRDLLVKLVSLKRLLDQAVRERQARRRRRVRLVVPQDCSWSDLAVAEGKSLARRLDETMRRIADANPRLEGLFVATEANESRAAARQALVDAELLLHVIRDLARLDLANDDVEGDVLGQTNEYLLAKCDDARRARDGHYYTPPEIVAVLSGMLGLTPNTRLHDPTCGSGGMLLHAAQWVREHHGPKAAATLKLSGQERDATTAALARLNLVLYDLACDIRGGSSTLTDPQFLTRGRRLQTFDAVLANFPFAQRDWGWETLRDDPFGRMEYGVPPQRSGDYAYLQHIVACLGPGGRAGVVCGQSVLFRDAEKENRAKMLADDVFETVVALPPKLFRGVDAPACLITLSRRKPRRRAGKVFFIDASASYEKSPEQNHLRSDDVERIVAAHRRGRDVADYCRLVDVDDIAPPLHGLTVGVYVHEAGKAKDGELRKAVGELRAARVARDGAMRALDRHLRELDLDD